MSDGWTDTTVIDGVGYSPADLSDAVEGSCGITSGFLWFDYDIKNPDIVESDIYSDLTALGLVCSVIEFVIGFAFNHCAKEEEDGGTATKKGDVELGQKGYPAAA